MSRVMFCALALSVLGLPGCSTFQKVYKYQSDQQKDYHDDWSSVRDEGRGEQPRTKETDGLTPFLESPEARAINRNLGID